MIHFVEMHFFTLNVAVFSFGVLLQELLGMIPSEKSTRAEVEVLLEIVKKCVSATPQSRPEVQDILLQVQEKGKALK